MISKILGPIGAKIGEIISKNIETPEDKAIKAESVEQAKIKTASDKLDLEHKKIKIQSDKIDISERAFKLAKELKNDPESAKIMGSLFKKELSNTQNITYDKKGKLK